MFCFLADEGFEQLSVEPVVTDPSCEYALKEEDLPEIMAEYDRLAQIIYDRRANGKWFNFFHFMVDLGGRPLPAQAFDGLRCWQRVCGGHTGLATFTPAISLWAVSWLPRWAACMDGTC